MQQILNSQDRNQAFLKFLLFFIITVLLVVTAIYFNYRVPVKDNKFFQNELEVQRIQDANQAKFVVKMEQAVDLLDSLDKPGANTDLVDNSLNSIIGEMNKFLSGGKTLYGRMDKVIWSKFDELRRAKKKILEDKDNADRIQSLKNELTNCNLAKEQAKRDLDLYRKPAQ